VTKCLKFLHVNQLSIHLDVVTSVDCIGSDICPTVWWCQCFRFLCHGLFTRWVCK